MVAREKLAGVILQGKEDVILGVVVVDRPDIEIDFEDKGLGRTGRNDFEEGAGHGGIA
jgi:hypothetical protein